MHETSLINISTSSRLEGFGYRLRDGVWRTPAEVKKFNSAPRQRAMAEGLVVPGMTDAEVIKARGKPDRVSRILTARSVIELWAYGKMDEAPLVVRLIRSGNRKVSIVTGEKRVLQPARPLGSELETDAVSESVDGRLSDPDSR